MERLSKKDMLFISLMLFSLFFGAGNLIFPPFLGQSAGTSLWASMAGFILSAVGLPILGVVAVAKANGLHSLASRVHPLFAAIFTFIIYLAIGPFLGIPRAGSLAFEMGVSPFLPKDMNLTFALFIYTFVYFGLSYWLALSPSKLVDRFGKLLTPIILLLILFIFVRALTHSFGAPASPTADYAKMPFAKGFLDGYLTMDTIAALNFGIVISLTLKQKGVSQSKQIVSYSIRAGLLAGLVLTLIYVMLGYLGTNNHGTTENGAQTLTQVVLTLFGSSGAVLLGVVFSLACLTTSVGLITSCSQYFTTIIPKVKYRTWVTILTGSSLVFANLGLTKILLISVPALTAIYPIAITLIILTLLNDLFGGSRTVYATTTLFVSIVSISDAFIQSEVNLGPINTLIQSLPLYIFGFNWLVPAAVGALIGFIIKTLTKQQSIKKSQQSKV
ncbi:branched-chain amino acid transport system II carrier protein [Bacillus aquiflavi]|uniref:Branched-chain amino acid transport system carrier protein n=1 Tax=Bacillus aquiflavi TaxID=2672567 RepID=A0A6B3VYB5_9BACI|nr:branched-chain amino acid transport system II carrier protein [Bacillus aquiflavi]MBA4536153.1 branched-chain amino acid transport system II carrier protein [Bacillus aquiflavi]NEY80526.1 branched-chain amino acid transport system II carrier protein [Bacillus aquiflavi]UAC47009.1 branched-chain amino acid transport system II carrier protein [Bacillus aquiflavi]